MLFHKTSWCVPLVDDGINPRRSIFIIPLASIVIGCAGVEDASLIGGVSAKFNPFSSESDRSDEGTNLPNPRGGKR